MSLKESRWILAFIFAIRDSNILRSKVSGLSLEINSSALDLEYNIFLDSVPAFGFVIVEPTI